MYPLNIKVGLFSIIVLMAISEHVSKSAKISKIRRNSIVNSNPDPDNPEENLSMDLFEGDILISDEEVEEMLDKGIAGAGIIGEHYRWPDRTIPYIISPDFSSRQNAIITGAMKEISDKTCIRFKRRENERNYIYIQDGLGCSSYVGRLRQGRQEVTLNRTGCVHHGIVIHELVHAIGFWHEQSRTDRGKYVEILTGNILAEAKENFLPYTSETINEFDVPYDYGSVMHYRADAFITPEARREGQITIKAFKSGVRIGQRRSLSTFDALKIIRMNCPERENVDSVTPRVAITIRTNVMSSGGHECVSECHQRGEAHSWCFINQKGQSGRNTLERDRCTPRGDQTLRLEAIATDRVVSAHGIPCGSKCVKGKNSTDHRCTTLMPWRSMTSDFCSPTPGYDHQLRECFTKCEYTANTYKWCYLEDGGMGFCSKTDDEYDLPPAELGAVTGRVTTAHGSYCKTKCEKAKDRDFNSCKTTTMVKGKDWDYCSPRRGQDYQGRKCTSKCGLHGRKFKWCRINETDSGFCSH